jgi:hypothetical protein
MKESGLRTFLDSEARRAWDTSIEKGEIPELTLENIASTFHTIHSSRGEMFERGVCEVFRRLSWSYKTNTPVKFGKRLIVTQLHTIYKKEPYWAVLNHSTTDELDDLVRVFAVLDGKNEPDYRYAIYSAISHAERAGASEFEYPYFSVRWYKKGTAHLTFKRPDLVAGLNRILAKHYPNALAAPRDPR